MRRSRRKWESSFLFLFNYNVSNSLDSAWKSANSLQVVFPIFVRDKYSSVGCIGTTTYRNAIQKQGADSGFIYLLFLNVPCVCHNVLNAPNQNAFAVLSLLLKIDRRQTSWHLTYDLLHILDTQVTHGCGMFFAWGKIAIFLKKVTKQCITFHCGTQNGIHSGLNTNNGISFL